MEIDDRLKLYASFADISRRWTAVMDAKAAFLSALNGGMLAFLWGGAKLADWGIVAKAFGSGSTLIGLLALGLALWVISPRQKLSTVVGKKTRWEASYHPISFYSYVAKAYGKDEFRKLEDDLLKMDAAAFTHEALEQHFNISHVIQAKSEWVSLTARLTLFAIGLAAAGLYFRCVE